MLAEPIVATAQGVVIGVSDVPDALGIVGAFVVIAGAFLVVKAGSSHEDKVESALNAAGHSESPAFNAARPPFSINKYT
jgi:drug/metabolite transporter (DMT)-like permease